MDPKKCVIKRKFKFKGYKNCLEAPQLENIKKINLMQIVLEKVIKNL